MVSHSRKMSFIQMALIGSLALLLSNCMSLGSYQTAQNIGADKFQGGFAVYKNDIKTESVSEIFDTSNISYYVPEAWVRYGIVDALEIGLKFVPIGLIANAKLQMIDSGVDIALDFGAGFTTFGTGESQIRMIDLNPSLLLTLNFTEAFSLTFVPKYLYRTYEEAGSSTNTSMLGVVATLGFQRQNGVRIMPEVGYFKENKENVTFLTYGIGFAFGF